MLHIVRVKNIVRVKRVLKSTAPTLILASKATVNFLKHQIIKAILNSNMMRFLNQILISIKDSTSIRSSYKRWREEQNYSFYQDALVINLS